MTTHDQLVADFGALLAPSYTLNAALGSGPATVCVGDGVLPGPIIAIPDVHLAGGGDGDVFLDGQPEKATRLAAVLRAVDQYLQRNPGAYALQLGDWFDVWRATGQDQTSMAYGPIQNAAVYRDILDLDAKIGLPHIIGNHDASFLNAVPDLRATQKGFFRLGAWLGDTVYAMHGHQTDLAPPVNSSADETAVALATTLASFVPGLTTFEAFIDRGFSIGSALGSWLKDTLRSMRDDPGPQARPRDTRGGSPDPNANFVVREQADTLVGIAGRVAAKAGGAKKPRVLLLGHSHGPCVGWSTAAGGTTIIVDAGGWVYKQANVLLGAGDRITVFDVVPA